MVSISEVKAVADGAQPSHHGGEHHDIMIKSFLELAATFKSPDEIIKAAKKVS